MARQRSPKRSKSAQHATASTKAKRFSRAQLVSGGLIGSLPLLLLWVVPGAVAALLLSLNAWTMNAHRAAQLWREVPCTIASSRFERTGEDGSALSMSYEYEYRGQHYTSDRLDLLPGRTGTDARWERELADRLPIGSQTVCYVDPAQPAEAVLDRDRSLTNVRTLRLLALPFLLATIVFFGMQLYLVFEKVSGAIRELQGDEARAPRERERTIDTATRLGLAPRRIGFGTGLALLLGRPKSALGAWLALTACLMLFWMLDGQTFFSGWGEWFAARETTSGTVRRILPTDNREWYATLYEVTYDYKVDGVPHQGHGFIRGHQYLTGDGVEVFYDPAAPKKGALPHSRQSDVPTFVPLIFLAVAVVVVAGLFSELLKSLRALRLLRHGSAATATLFAEDGLLVYRFSDGIVEHDIPCHGETIPSGDAVRITVLYDPTRPERHVVYDVVCEALPTTSDGSFPRVTLGELFPQILIPPIALVLIAFIYWMTLPT
jgi:Protein of unknown function (DUF3592)